MEGIRCRMKVSAPTPPYVTFGSAPGSSGARRNPRPARTTPAPSMSHSRPPPPGAGSSRRARTLRVIVRIPANTASTAVITAANIQCCSAPPARSSAPAATPRPPSATRSATSTTAIAIASNASAVAYPTAVQATKADAATATATVPVRHRGSRTPSAASAPAASPIITAKRAGVTHPSSSADRPVLERRMLSTTG